jgi:hypothetical protein
MQIYSRRCEKGLILELVGGSEPNGNTRSRAPQRKTCVALFKSYNS